MQEIEPGPETQRAFREALGRFATGVTVVTAPSDLGPLGITANSFASVSLDPPLVLWSPARASRRFQTFADAKHFAIHVLGEEQAALAAQFSREGHDFAGLDWRENGRGVPLIRGCLARFECARAAVHPGGDHAIVVARVLRCKCRPGQPLVFNQGTMGAFAPVAGG